MKNVPANLLKRAYKVQAMDKMSRFQRLVNKDAAW